MGAWAATETLSRENLYKCAACKKEVQATKQLRLSRLPQVLLVHLERFDVVEKVFTKGTEKALILKVRLNLTAVNDIVTNVQPLML